MSKLAEDARSPSGSTPEDENWFRTILDDQAEFVLRWRLDGTRSFVNRAYC